VVLGLVGRTLLASCLVVCGWGAVIEPARALSVEVQSSVIPETASAAGMTLNRVRLTGPFEKGDADKLRVIFDQIRLRGGRGSDGSLAVVELSSGGGDILEGVKVGYLFREFDVATLVRRGDRCLSACAVAFLGGTARHSALETFPARRIEIGGQVGLHNMFLNYLGLKNAGTPTPEAAAKQGFDLALSGASTIVRYVTDMGIDAGFIARLLGSPTEHFDYVESIESFAALGICPTEAFMPRLPLEQQAANLCNNALGWGKADPTQAVPMPPREARLVLLAQVQGNISSFNVPDRLAAQISAVIASRDDTLATQLYDSLRRAGVRLPELYGGMSEVTGYNAGPYNVSCDVSLSMNEPDRYDLVIVGPRGIVPAPRTAPRECRWLFRFDRRAVINPKP
jgi:hypothetical protein